MDVSAGERCYVLVSLKQIPLFSLLRKGDSGDFIFGNPQHKLASA